MNQDAVETQEQTWTNNRRLPVAGVSSVVSSSETSELSSGQSRRLSLRADEHPWLAQLFTSEDEDSVGEVIRYTLDELRFA